MQTIIPKLGFAPAPSADSSSSSSSEGSTDTTPTSTTSSTLDLAAAVTLASSGDTDGRLAWKAHVDYIRGLDAARDTFEYWLTEHLRVSGGYWGLSAMALLNSLSLMDREAALATVLACRHPCGGFGGNVNHDVHLLYTLSAVQILCLYDALDRLDVESVVAYVASLQNRDDGSFKGDEWGEVDTRFSYCAINCLSLLGRLDAIDVPKAVEFIVRCKNFDGAFGCLPGAESHAGQSMCLSHSHK